MNISFTDNQRGFLRVPGVLALVTGSDAVKEVVAVLGDALEADPDDVGVKVDTAHLCNKEHTKSKLELEGDSLLMSLKSL